ncbi:hypothetical protein Tco_0278537 [Tanacetum coccineum]
MEVILQDMTSPRQWWLLMELVLIGAMALMAFSDFDVNNDKTCSNTYLKSFEALKTQLDNLRVEFNKSEFNLATYKRGLASVEEQLVFYKKNEVMFCDKIVVLKRDASFKDSEINALNIQIEKLKKEKESNQIKIDNFENASKNLDKLIGSQIYDNNRKGVGYNAIPPPPTGLFAPPTIDLSSSGLKEFQQLEFEGYRVNVNKSVSENSSNEIKKITGAPIIEDWVSDCDEDESEVMVFNNVQHKSELKPEQAKQPRKIREIFPPTAVLTKSGIVPISTARQRSLRAAAPLSINTDAPKLFVNVAKTKPNVFQKTYSLSRRPFNQQTTLNNRSLNNKVNTTKVNSVNTAKGKKVTSVVREQWINAVKSSTCWVWRPKRNIVDHTSKNSRSYICKQFDYVDLTDRLKFRSLKCWLYTTQQMVINSPCLIDKKRIGYSRANDNWYALTTNPTIYVSLIEQFWQTVNVDTVNDGEQQLTVTVDWQTIAITEASVRRHI